MHGERVSVAEGEREYYVVPKRGQGETCPRFDLQQVLKRIRPGHPCL